MQRRSRAEFRIPAALRGRTGADAAGRLWVQPEVHLVQRPVRCVLATESVLSHAVPGAIPMESFVAAIHNDDRSATKRLLRADPGLATLVFTQPKFYQSKIFHWIYVGDTLLHLAAAGYRTEI